MTRMKRRTAAPPGKNMQRIGLPSTYWVITYFCSSFGTYHQIVL